MKRLHIGLMALLLSGLAGAEEAPDSPAFQKGPCREDIPKVCPGVVPGQGRMATCLALNREKLSPECRATITTAVQSVKNGPCHADAQKLCGSTQPGQGRMRSCLREHKNELSAECKAKVMSLTGRRQGMQGQAGGNDDESDL